MSSEPPATEVFEDVEADPDAVLEEFGASSPDDVADAADGGAHDPTTDDRIDADDTLAEELFADLAEVDTEPADDSAPASGAGRAGAGPASDATAGPIADADDARVHPGEPTVVVDEGGAAAIDDFFATLEAAIPSTEGLALVGPAPDRVRLEGDGPSVDAAAATDPQLEAGADLAADPPSPER